MGIEKYINPVLLGITALSYSQAALDTYAVQRLGEKLKADRDYHEWCTLGAIESDSCPVRDDGLPKTCIGFPHESVIYLCSYQQTFIDQQATTRTNTLRRAMLGFGLGTATAMLASTKVIYDSSHRYRRDKGLPKN